MSEYITHSRTETVALGKRMAAVLVTDGVIRGMCCSCRR